MYRKRTHVSCWTAWASYRSCDTMIDVAENSHSNGMSKTFVSDIQVLALAAACGGNDSLFSEV